VEKRKGSVYLSGHREKPKGGHADLHCKKSDVFPVLHTEEGCIALKKKEKPKTIWQHYKEMEAERG